MKLLKYVVGLAVTVALTACGGGGESGNGERRVTAGLLAHPQ